MQPAYYCSHVCPCDFRVATQSQNWPRRLLDLPPTAMDERTPPGSYRCRRGSFKTVCRDRLLAHVCRDHLLAYLDAAVGAFVPLNNRFANYCTSIITAGTHWCGAPNAIDTQVGRWVLRPLRQRTTSAPLAPRTSRWRRSCLPAPAGGRAAPPPWSPPTSVTRRRERAASPTVTFAVRLPALNSAAARTPHGKARACLARARPACRRGCQA